jgi:hypothetical protein
MVEDEGALVEPAGPPEGLLTSMSSAARLPRGQGDPGALLR